MSGKRIASLVFACALASVASLASAQDDPHPPPGTPPFTPVFGFTVHPSEIPNTATPAGAVFIGTVLQFIKTLAMSFDDCIRLHFDVIPAGYCASGGACRWKAGGFTNIECIE